MDNTLNREDWVRILHALSHFRHNDRYRETHEKVARILNGSEDD